MNLYLKFNRRTRKEWMDYKKISSIYQQLFAGGVAQLVRARDS